MSSGNRYRSRSRDRRDDRRNARSRSRSNRRTHSSSYRHKRPPRSNMDNPRDVLLNSAMPASNLPLDRQMSDKDKEEIIKIIKEMIYKSYTAKLFHEHIKKNTDELMEIRKEEKSELGETFVDSYNVSYKVGEKALLKVKSQNSGDQVKTHQKIQKAIYRLYPTIELADRECLIMRKLNCEYLHKLYHYDIASSLSIWEYYDMCLDDKLYCNIDNLKIELILRQILCGLKYMHDNNFVHGNLKISNIIVTHRNIVKISDFRFAEKKNHSNFKRDLNMLGELFNYCLRSDYNSFNGSLRRKYGLRSTLLRLMYLRLLNGRITLTDALRSLVFAEPKHYIALIVNFCKKMEIHNGFSAKPKLYKAITKAAFCNNWVEKIDKDFYEALKKERIEIRHDLFGLLRLCRNLESHQIANSLLDYIGDDDGKMKHFFDAIPLLIPFVDDMTRAMEKENEGIYNDIIDVYTMLSDKQQLLTTDAEFVQRLRILAKKPFCSAGYLIDTNTKARF